MTAILAFFGIIGAVGLILLACYLYGRKSYEADCAKAYKKDIDNYVKKREKVDRVVNSRRKYSDSDILSGKPLQDNKN